MTSLLKNDAAAVPLPEAPEGSLELQVWIAGLRAFPHRQACGLQDKKGKKMKLSEIVEMQEPGLSP